MWPSLLAVFFGGVLGTGARLGVDLLVPHETAGAMAWSTVLVNICGSFILGILVATLWRRPGFPIWLRAGIGSGILGSFTTLSAMAINVVASVMAMHLFTAVVELLASTVLGLLAAWAGLTLGGMRRRSATVPDEGADI